LSLIVLGFCLVLLGGRPAQATQYDLTGLFANASFESGLGCWSYTGAGINVTYLTNAEWNAQTWSTSSPFYTDAQLAIYYPGKPWGLDPNITHIDQTGVPDDPTTTITAAAGMHFIGSRQDGYDGHYRRDASEPVQPDGGYYDTNFQLTSDPINGSFQSGDTFILTVWGVRGRLRQDWATPNASTPGSASKLTARLTGGTFQTASFDFTNWAADGRWAMQVFTWQLQASTSSISIVITGQNQNHDRFVAVDLGLPPVSVQPSTWGLIKELFRDATR
jgi:hypothetical protein